MEDNKSEMDGMRDYNSNESNGQAEDDFADFADMQYAPIEINVTEVKPVVSKTSGSLAGIMEKGVIATAVLLIIDMFLPYVKIYMGDTLLTSSSLFPGMYAFGLIGLAIATLVFLYLRRETYMVGAAGMNVLLCLRTATRAGYADFAVKTAAKGLISVKMGIGFGGMILFSIGLGIFALGYILSTDIRGNR